MEFGVPNPVAPIFGVLRSIELDDQVLLETNKVRNIGPDWHLTAELLASKTPVTQQTPKS